MKFSTCSWTFGNKPIKDIMKFAAETGYDEIEVHANVETYDWEQIKQYSRDFNIDIKGLSGDTSWPREETDMANPDPENRRRAINHFKRQLDAANVVGANYIVVSPSPPGKSRPLGNGDEDWNWAVDSIQKLAPYAKEKGVKLIIEPLNRYESCILNNAKHVKQFVQEVGLSNVKAMLDTFHMNIEETNLITPFIELGSDLGHIHVADTNRQGVGRGRLPFEEVVSGIKECGYNGTITVECLAPGADPFDSNKKGTNMDWIYTYAEESLQQLRHYFPTEAVNVK